jgi:5-methyltetrahydrofolate--homocysteine methyltransferase
MRALFDEIARCTELGKVSRHAPYPPEMAQQDGVEEVTSRALAQGLSPAEIVSQGLMAGMNRIGHRFGQHEVFVPDLLMAARAMAAGLDVLKPSFRREDFPYSGTLVIGTVRGDLHDIGKNLVSMVFEGSGWRVVDLGVDTCDDGFLAAIANHPDCVVGLSALLTTTTASMERTVGAIKAQRPEVVVLVGGAPVTPGFASAIGADHYASSPYQALDYLAAQRQRRA